MPAMDGLARWQNSLKVSDQLLDDIRSGCQESQ
jgi:hypothetical protein